jgi:hypothetical protein
MQTSFWNDSVVAPLRHFANEALGFLLNNLLAMLLVLALGILVAFVARVLLRVLLRLVRFDQMCERQGVTALLRTAGIARALNVQPMNDLISRLFLFIPQVIAAVIILVLGYLAAAFLHRAVLLAAVNAGLPRARILATTVQILALLFTVAVALEQAGIGRSIVLATFTVAFGSLGLAAALAFGYAARDLARSALERQLTAPDRDLGGISHL